MSKKIAAVVKVRHARRNATTVDHFGRILIPKAIREATGLREGIEVEFVPDGRQLRVVPSVETPLVERREGMPVIVGHMAGDATGAVERHREERLRRLGGGH